MVKLCLGTNAQSASSQRFIYIPDVQSIGGIHLASSAGRQHRCQSTAGTSSVHSHQNVHQNHDIVHDYHADDPHHLWQLPQRHNGLSSQEAVLDRQTHRLGSRRRVGSLCRSNFESIASSKVWCGSWCSPFDNSIFVFVSNSIQPTSRPFFRHGHPAFGDSEVRSSRIERPSLPDIHNLYLLRNGLSPFRSQRLTDQYIKSPLSFAPEGRIGAVSLLNLFAQILRIAPTTTTTITTIVSSIATSFTTSTATLIISLCSPGLTYAPCV